MTQAKHTPGPWNAEIYEHGEFAIEAHGQGHSGGTLVICSRNRHQGRPTEFEANARLIAAAPELLSVLKMVQEAAIDMRGEDFNLTTEQWAVFRAVITKATGSNQ